MTTLIGRTLLERYRVDSWLASGGMGTVFQVYDTQRGVPLAMKVLHTDMADDPSAFKRFEREGRALQKLRHPNIVPFYGLYRTIDMTFLLEQYIDGPTLKQVLRDATDSQISITQSLIYIKAIASALGYAHQHDVIHCDVKPGNVMVDRGGTIYLADFGIARHAESSTTTLGFAGTAAYMAPEQCRAEPVTPATDVYALGVIAYEMLAGRRPFLGDEKETQQSGTGAERVRYAHLYLEPPDPQTFQPDLPPAVAEVILQALHKTPQERFGNVNAFFLALSRAAGIPTETIPDRVKLQFDGPRAPETSQGEEILAPSPHLQTRKPIPAWAFAAGGAALVLVIALVAGSGGDGGGTNAQISGLSDSQLQTQVARTVEARIESSAQPLNGGSTAGGSSNQEDSDDEASSVIASPTRTSTLRPPTNTPTPGPRAPYRPISGCPFSRLEVGDWTRVSLVPPICTNLRNEPTTDSRILICVDPGVTMRVRGGPVCDGGWLWWQMHTDDGDRGWMAEGNGSSYWVDAGTQDEPR